MSSTTPPRNGSLPHDAHGFAPIYHQRRLSPIPVPYRSKEPGYKGWQTERIKPEDFERRFPAGEQKNIAVHNGAPSDGHHDVDLDCPEALAVGRMLLPPTGWVFGRTSTPDAHRIYKSERSFAKAHEKYRDVDGTCLVELRGTGGITIYPPSAHDETGEPIRWQTFTEPGELQLVDLERAVAEVAAATLLARHWPGSGWHDATLALAGGLLRGGMPQERVEQVIEAVWQTAGTDDKPSDRNGAVRTTAEKIAQGEKVAGWPKLVEHLGPDGSKVVSLVRKWLGMVPPISTAKPPARKPLVIPPYRPFPVEALPSPLRQYVEQAAAALGCDVAFVALPALAAVAGLIGNTRVIRLKRDWTEPSVLWCALVADSGTLKSPAHAKAVSHLFTLQKRLLEMYKQDMAAYEQQLAAWQAAKKKKGKDAADAGDKPEEPKYVRVITTNTTIEKVVEIVEDNPRGTFVGPDELATWFASFTKYKGKQGGSDLHLWLEAHRAGPWIVDRKTGERRHYFVPHAAISVAGGIQPGTLARVLTDDTLDAGLAARLLMAMPPKQPKRWTTLEVDQDTENAYHQLLDGVRARGFNEDEDGSTPNVLKLSPEAQAVWVAFYDVWAKYQAAAEGDMAACLSKLEGTAARLALLHHVVAHVALQTSDLRPIGQVSMEAGITLCRWFADEARRVYLLLAESAEQCATRRLVEFIKSRGGAITVKALQRSNQRKYPTAEAAETALELLVRDGIGRWEERGPGTQGGRPTRILVLLCDETDETPPDGDGSGLGPCDETGDETPSDSHIPNVSEGFVSFVTQGSTNHEQRAPTPDAEGGFVTPEGVSSHISAEEPDPRPSPQAAPESPGAVACPAYCLVNTDADLATVCRTLEESALQVGLDTETTGLDPRTDRVRLLSLSVSTDGADWFTYVVDLATVDPSPLWWQLAEKEVIAHNAAFDLAFLTRMGFEPAVVHDTMLLSQLLHAGEIAVKHNLKDAVQRELNITLDKSGQKSDWSGRLTQEQIEYAAKDAEVLVPLYRKLASQITAANLEHAAGIERRALPALVWTGQSGCPFDRQTWTALAERAEHDRQTAEAELDRLAPPKPGNLHDGSWTWSSNPQVKDALKLVGHEVEDTGDATLAAIDHPLAAALRQYRDAAKRVSTYGADWLEHVADDGRVYASWRQLGAASGRMSCSKPNLQQLPRGEYRRCVVAPPGRVFVKADYSQVELRIAAKVSGDSAMLAAYQQGEDLHTLTARKVLGIKEVTKEHRQIAKALNFGLLFGMGYRGFRTYAKTSYGVDLTEEQAKQYRDAFFLAYPKLAVWHRRTGIALDNAKGDTWETRTLADRRRLFSRSKKSGKLPYTEVLNTPVQGTGADGLKAALGLLWERRHQVPGAFPVLIVHDEIVLECDEDQAAGSVAPWLRQAMVQGMAPLIAPVPVEVEVQVVKTWGGD